MKYIILSLKHGTPDRPVFWRANNCGYTYSPFEAGQYDEKRIKGEPGYYNDGYSAVAIPLTDGAIGAIGFQCSFNLADVEKFWEQSQLKATSHE
jgi:hypothetical protein